MSQARHERPKDFGAFRESLFQHFESLSPHLKRIARYALGEPNRFALRTVAQVASEAGVQPSTLIRFAKAFGFSGYSDMQQIFRLQLIDAETAFRDRTIETQRRMDAVARDDAPAILDALADASVLAIERLKAHIDADTFGEAVRLMESANLIYVIGRGRALPVTACLAHGLIELQRRCVVLDAVAGMMPQQVAAMGPGDVLIAAGFEGESQPVVDAVGSAHARQVPVIAIADSVLGPLARQSRLNFAIRKGDIDGVSPLAPYIVLVQSLVVALGRREAGHEDAAVAAAAPADE